LKLKTKEALLNSASFSNRPWVTPVPIISGNSGQQLLYLLINEHYGQQGIILQPRTKAEPGTRQL